MGSMKPKVNDYRGQLQRLDLCQPNQNAETKSHTTLTNYDHYTSGNTVKSQKLRHDYEKYKNLQELFRESKDLEKEMKK